MQNKTIKQHLANKYAELASLDIKTKYNNGESLFEQECNEFAELFRIELLKANGYED